ncbi:MAG: alpha/beta hydrolase [Hydrocarboniphaga sp.]|uniref:alpha/beta fold hydrolase n=1 Tax=Hydrocarboniphaga sp. TaxID=2033016 RepID=UPI00261B6E65|nr:alpha/beta hydrolase [Hydrocarboniphaga sp.]MDB5972649.1 alpha/beta hydrolase [Hydrocarboniphaga sp.]
MKASRNKTSEFQLTVSKSAIAFVRCWLPAGPLRGVIQLIHGMAEHSGRYQRLAAALTAEGYAVYAQDLPGHGRTARAPDELGHFSETAGWRLALQSIRCLQREIGEWHDGAPQFILGHSMGSFLLQDYLSRHAHDLAGAVLSASTADAGLLRAVGLALLKAEGLWRGYDERSALAEQLTFKSYNRQFAPTRTAFDWLSRDPVEVDRYVADPQCGFRCTSGLWVQLLEAMGRLDSRRAARVPKHLALLAIAGEDDPVCAGRKGPLSLQKRYRDAGLSDVTALSYPKARHELLNDICRDEVTADLIGWFNQRTASA